MPIDVVQVLVPSPVDTINLQTVGPQGPAVGGGGSPVVGGKRHLLASTFQYTTGASGDGTEIIPLTWTYNSSGSGGPAGPTDTANYPDVTFLTDGENSGIQFNEDAYYSAVMTWAITFPNSAPTRVVSFFSGVWLQPDLYSYDAVIPAGGPSGNPFYSGNWSSLAHTRGTAHTGVFWADDSSNVLTPRIWWNTDDTTPGTVQIQVAVTKYGGLE